MHQQLIRFLTTEEEEQHNNHTPEKIIDSNYDSRTVRANRCSNRRGQVFLGLLVNPALCRI